MLDFNKHFIPLVQELEKRKISFKIRSCADGLAIVFDDGSDVALNSATYGHKEGLLEGYNGVFKNIYDDVDVTGYMTCAEVMELFS